MNTITTTASTIILAIDLGKYKSVVRIRDDAVPMWEHAGARPRKAVWCRLGFAERDTAMRTTPMLHERQSGGRQRA